eukprot:1577824-Rhodomonas_salina.4
MKDAKGGKGGEKAYSRQIVRTARFTAHVCNHIVDVDFAAGGLDERANNPPPARTVPSNESKHVEAIFDERSYIVQHLYLSSSSSPVHCRSTDT